ncbi:TetR family transcriptional regulator [Nonomuraea rhodomycinica]|uniref:TetR family transcriptional regulator n=1 Tax=Nonomuraea rhodomycinica TaxID=1712872 RepID=A0A7Y6IRT7_9ACTN|nr:TetR family transcriptional regulator [Nonomuraea rhodomycinica]NUW41949.1 TetR family transcriptional regulator [Nonomuraea rhodomycinica]
MATIDALTPERILEATEEVLRRHGPAKATVVDVARALGVSHGSVYRHFRTKTALREAVTQRWLDRTSMALSGVVAGSEPPGTRLRRWLAELFAAKRRKVGDDPELFATYMVLVGESSAVVNRHRADLTGQLARIIHEGLERGEFAPAGASPEVLARAVFDATGRFHDPAYAREWAEPGIDAEFTALVDLVLRGLAAP